MNRAISGNLDPIPWNLIIKDNLTKGDIMVKPLIAGILLSIGMLLIGCDEYKVTGTTTRLYQLSEVNIEDKSIIIMDVINGQMSEYNISRPCVTWSTLKRSYIGEFFWLDVDIYQKTKGVRAIKFIPNNLYRSFCRGKNKSSRS